MKSINVFGLLGSLLVIGGAMSPMLHIPVVGNWSYYDLDVALASIVMTLATLGIIASVINKRGLLKFAGWGALFMIILTLIAVYFKVNDYFSFIPMKKLAAALSGIVKYRWTGWILLFIGSALMIVGSRRKAV